MTKQKIRTFSILTILLFLLCTCSDTVPKYELLKQWQEIENFGLTKERFDTFQEEVQKISESDEFQILSMSQPELTIIMDEILVLKADEETNFQSLKSQLGRLMARYFIENEKINDNTFLSMYTLLILFTLFITLFLLFVFLYIKQKKRSFLLKTNLITEQASIRIQEEERNRIYRELHDTIAQDSRAALFSLHDLKRFIEPNSESQKLYNTIENSEMKNMQNIRNIIRNIVPPELMNDVRRVFKEWCTQYSIANGISCQIVIKDDAPLEKLHNSYQLNLFRIMQEAVQNAKKHSGSDEVSVLIRAGKQENDKTTLNLIVSDDGVGFDIAAQDLKTMKTGHYGLRGMSERALLMGGTMNIITMPEGGVQIHVEIPVITGS